MSDYHTHWSWSHNLEDYNAFFALTEEDEKSKILDCAAGSACFTAQMRQQGREVIACDPLYGEPFEGLKETVKNMGVHLLQCFRSQMEEQDWDPGMTLSQLEAQQARNAAVFLKDYSQGLDKGYYQRHSLPNLPFKDYQFDLALCANFLFDARNYTHLAPYLAGIRVLARVAREVRIFPLVNEKGELSNHVGPVIAALQSEGYGMEIHEVTYTLQKGANALLRIWPQKCFVGPK